MPGKFRIEQKVYRRDIGRSQKQEGIPGIPSPEVAYEKLLEFCQRIAENPDYYRYNLMRLEEDGQPTPFVDPVLFSFLYGKEGHRLTERFGKAQDLLEAYAYDNPPAPNSLAGVVNRGSKILSACYQLLQTIDDIVSLPVATTPYMGATNEAAKIGLKNLAREIGAAKDPNFTATLRAYLPRWLTHKLDTPEEVGGNNLSFPELLSATKTLPADNRYNLRAQALRTLLLLELDKKDQEPPFLIYAFATNMAEEVKRKKGDFSLSFESCFAEILSQTLRFYQDSDDSDELQTMATDLFEILNSSYGTLFPLLLATTLVRLDITGEITLPLFMQRLESKNPALAEAVKHAIEMTELPRKVITQAEVTKIFSFLTLNPVKEKETSPSTIKELLFELLSPDTQDEEDGVVSMSFSQQLEPKSAQAAAEVALFEDQINIRVISRPKKVPERIIDILVLLDDLGQPKVTFDSIQDESIDADIRLAALHLVTIILNTEIDRINHLAKQQKRKSTIKKTLVGDRHEEGRASTEATTTLSRAERMQQYEERKAQLKLEKQSQEAKEEESLLPTTPTAEEQKEKRHNRIIVEGLSSENIERLLAVDNIDQSVVSPDQIRARMQYEIQFAESNNGMMRAKPFNRDYLGPNWPKNVALIQISCKINGLHLRLYLQILTGEKSLRKYKFVGVYHKQDVGQKKFIQDLTSELS